MMDDMLTDPSLLKYKPEELKLLDLIKNTGFTLENIQKVLDNPGLLKTFLVMTRSHQKEESENQENQ